MNLAPLIARELRIRSRAWQTYYSRVGIGLIGILGFASVALSMVITGVNTGAFSFGILSTIISFYATFAGANATCDSLGREKREGTLGFLLLSDLKPIEIILGKLAAGAMVPLANILTLFPLIGLCHLLGGVGVSQFWTTFIQTLATLFFALAVGLQVSLWAKDRQSAYSWSIAIIIAGNLLFSGGVFGSTVLFGVNLGGATGALAGIPMTANAWMVWVPTLLKILIGSVLLGSTAFNLKHNWREEPQRTMRLAVKGPPPPLGSRRPPPLPKVYKPRNRALLDINPILFIISAPFKSINWAWIGPLLVFGGVFILITAIGFSQKWPDYEPFHWAYFSLTTIFTLFIPSFVASESCQRVMHERKANTLELILTTPVSIRQFFTALKLHAHRKFFPTFLLLSLLNISISLGFVLIHTGRPSIGFIYAAVVAALLALWGPFTAWAALRSGAYRGLRARNASDGGARWVVVTPFLLTMLLLSVGSIVVKAAPSFVVMLITYLIVHFSYTLWTGNRSEKLFHQEFRMWATVPFGSDAPTGVWGALGRFVARLIHQPRQSKSMISG